MLATVTMSVTVTRPLHERLDNADELRKPVGIHNRIMHAQAHTTVDRFKSEWSSRSKIDGRAEIVVLGGVASDNELLRAWIICVPRRNATKSRDILSQLRRTRAARVGVHARGTRNHDRHNRLIVTSES